VDLPDSALEAVGEKGCGSLWETTALELLADCLHGDLVESQHLIAPALAAKTDGLCFKVDVPDVRPLDFREPRSRGPEREKEPPRVGRDVIQDLYNFGERGRVVRTLYLWLRFPNREHGVVGQFFDFDVEGENCAQRGDLFVDGIRCRFCALPARNVS